MKDIGVIGNGKIGKAVASLLRAENFSITVADAIGGPAIMPNPQAKIRVPAAEVICFGVRKSLA